jgi:DNA-binding transcriptional LysR family regulator
MNAMHIDDLDLTQIRLLAELSRSRSVSRAAQRIGVSQSAASHALAKLRKKLADPLFTRSQDGFQPTPFGARLAHASCEALDALLAGLAANDFFDPLTSTRTFSFFMNDIGQTVFLPPLLKFFKHKAPGISARVLPVPQSGRGAQLGCGRLCRWIFRQSDDGILAKSGVPRTLCLHRARRPPDIPRRNDA